MSNTALLLIDIQNDYFSDGKWPLVDQEKAAYQAVRLLKHFRDNNLSVFHVRHLSDNTEAPFFAKGTSGSEIHKTVLPLKEEQIFIKSEINCFKDTDLLQALREQNISKLVIVGSMSHMCIDAATRAASDYGFDCTVAKDACATLDLEFDGNITPAAQVHNAFMSGLAFAYAKVISTDEAISRT
ncbi:cysteine hydrolase family protein [Kiloniella antarctica]|uniref:Cysteine hydrolase family protein n=1 Tax=Kiloniella antarctica TaxID=1550907 RepID=A0ABW5BK26_9PROT